MSPVFWADWLIQNILWASDAACNCRGEHYCFELIIIPLIYFSDKIEYLQYANQMNQIYDLKQTERVFVLIHIERG